MSGRRVEVRSDAHSQVFASFIESLHKERGFDFSDVTLVSDDNFTTEAHKILLSSHSNFFGSILKKHVHAHPLIFLNGINSSYLALILDYIYNGEVKLYEEQLSGFLDAAEKLKIKNFTKIVTEDAVKHGNAVLGKAILNDVKVENEVASICESNQNLAIFEGQEGSAPIMKPPAKVINSTPTFLDILDESVFSSKQTKKAQGDISTEQKVESQPNKIFAKSPDPAKKSERHKEKLQEEMLKDLIAFNGMIFICKCCGQKSKNKDFILKHVRTHPYAFKRTV